MEVLTELIKILSEDAYLLENKVKFLDSLGISASIVGPWLKLFDMGHCRPYDLVKMMLTEWITIKKDAATVAELRRILREDGFLKISDKLEGLQKMHPGPIKIPELETSRRSDSLGVIPQPHFSGYPPLMEISKRPITFGMKSVVQNFTGREEELARLNAYFHSGETPIVLISGIGKTELAKKFTLDISDSSGNGQIVKCWLSGENPQSLLNSTSEFCDELQLPSKGEDGQPLSMQKMIQNIMTKLKSSAEFFRWVVIIDNVDDIHPQFETAVQTLSEFGPDAFLLVTSRRRDIYEGEVELLEVTDMKLESSIKLVRKSLKISDNSSDDSIKTLCEKLDNFPLALNQAAAFINQQQSSTLKGRSYKIENYLEELTKNERLCLNNRKLGYSTATLAVWDIAMDKIKENSGTEGQLALDLLDAMAFMNPDDIPIPFLQKLYIRFYNMQEITLNQIQDSLTLLLKYSLISSDGEVLKIHRLVQLALRDRMSSKSSTEDKEPSKAVEMLKQFWTSFASKEWNKIEMRNILTIWNHTAQYKELNAHRAVKMSNVCTQLHNLGMVNEFYDFSIKGSKFLELYGPEDPDYFGMQLTLAVALVEKGQYEPALQKFTDLYWKLVKSQGVNDFLTLAVGYRIAIVLYDLERYEDSLEWGEKILQSQIEGPNKIDIVMSAKHVVAMTLRKLGKKEEAQEIFYEKLKWEEVNLGANHESTLTTRHDIAVCLHDDGMFQEALKIFQEVLQLKETALGAEHPKTIITKKWVADTLVDMGEIDKALALWEEVLVASEKVLGADHPKTIIPVRRVAFLKKLKLRNLNKQ